MRILFVLPELAGGGIGTYYRNQIEFLKGQGHHIVVYLPPDAYTAQNDLGVEVRHGSVEDVARFRKNFSYLDTFPLLHEGVSLAWALYQAAGKETYDIVEVTDYKLLFLPWLVLDKKAPVVVRLAGSTGQVEEQEQRYGQGLETALLRYVENETLISADGLVALSTSNQQYWEKRLCRTVQLIYPYMNVDQRRRESSSSTELTTDQTYGIVLGRVQVWKGAENLCKAVSLIDKNVNCKIYWVGGDNYYRTYEKSMVEHLSTTYKVWGSSIQYLPRQPYAEAQSLLRNAAYQIVPSTWDTFNFTLVEGMMDEKVIVAADGVGASEHILNGANGFVYSANDYIALSKLLDKVINLSSGVRKIIGSSAGKSATEIFGQQELGQQKLELYENLINNQPVPIDIRSIYIRKAILDNRSAISKENLLDKMSIRQLIKGIINGVKRKVILS